MKALTGDQVAEIIGRITELIKTAGSGGLALAAFAFLLGCGATIYLLRRTSPLIRLSGTLGWMAFNIVILAILLPPPVVVPPLVQMNIDGDAPVEGRKFVLDLGEIPAASTQQIMLAIDVDRDVRSAGWTTANETAVVRWQGGKLDAELAANKPSTFQVIIHNAPVSGQQQFDAHLSMDDQQLVTLRIRYIALPAAVEVTAHSGPRPSGRGQDFSSPYRICAQAPTPGSYVGAEKGHSLTGDRSCGSWATCTVTTEADGRAVCLTFTLQGHNECQGLLKNCEAVRSSEGHISAIFKLRQSAPKLSTFAG